MFQIHLWMGIALCLYITVEGITGSILVFQHDLNDLPIRHLLYTEPPSENAVPLDAERILDSVRATYPDVKFLSLFMPSAANRNATLYISTGGRSSTIAVNPYTAECLGAIPSHITWTAWVARLHIYLLAGNTGRTVNGVGGIFLLLLCISGAVIWWPGIRNWTRGLKISRGANWKRINLDLHSAIGFWTLSILAIWAVSTIYFVWPKQSESLVEQVSSLKQMRPPKFTVPPRSKGPWPEWSSMFHDAEKAIPRGKIATVFFPRREADPLTVLIAKGDVGDFSNTDYVYFDPSTGTQLAVWRRGERRTWGTRFLELMRPIHFGREWGLAFQIIWAVLGLALPLLSITGVLMYWNRFLSNKWRKLRAADSRIVVQSRGLPTAGREQ